MTARHPASGTADSGASLILAIGFVLMVGAISAGLVGLATTSLNNRNTLTVVRNRQYAADGAIVQAIARVRTLTNAAAAGAVCSLPTDAIFDTETSIVIRVEWVNVCGVVQGTDGTVVAQHNVVFSACVSVTGAACDAGNVIIRAEVNFEQPLGGAVTKTFIQSWSVNR